MWSHNGNLGESSQQQGCYSNVSILVPFLTVIMGAVRSVGLFHLLGFVGLLSELSHEEVSGGLSGQIPQSIV